MTFSSISDCPSFWGERLPLADYQIEQQDSYTFSIKLSLGLGDASIEVEYRDLPRPDRDGLFHIEGNYRVVVPYPDRRELDQARILCVGEQLYDFVDQRLEAAPEQLAWDDDLVRNWLPFGRLAAQTSTWRKLRSIYRRPTGLTAILICDG